jgi:hypothetical protein
MKQHATYVCPDAIHAGHPLDCPDRLIDRWADGRHIIIIREGPDPKSGVVLSFCPWCGKRLAS